MHSKISMSGNGTFDAAFLDDTPLPTKFRPPNLRCAYRAIDSVRRVNFQSGMRSYVAEQNLKTLSAKSSRTNVSSNCGIICDSFPSSTSSSQISVSSSPQSGQRLTVRSLPASRAVSSCNLLQQVRLRTHSNENLLPEKKVLEQQLFELQKKLNVALGNSESAGKELQALQLEIEDLKSKFKCETKFLMLVVKALEGAVWKLSQPPSEDKMDDSHHHESENKIQLKFQTPHTINLK